MRGSQQGSRHALSPPNDHPLIITVHNTGNTFSTLNIIQVTLRDAEPFAGKKNSNSGLSDYRFLPSQAA